MLGIVESRADEASTRIADHLRRIGDWTAREDRREGIDRYWTAGAAELRAFGDLHIYLDDPATAFSGTPDLLAVVSRHSGETGPLLTAHHTGNFGPADYGGRPGAFAPAAPAAHRRVLGALDRHAPEGYEVGTECTHHGPTETDVPLLFVEVGSAEPQWRDDDAAAAVARAVLALRGVDPRAGRAVAGLGGGHYAPRFERVIRETPWAVAHVGADWAIEAMGDLDPDPDPDGDDAGGRDDAGDGAGNGDVDRRVLRRALAASGTDRVLIDGDRPRLRAAVRAVGAEVVSETWLREAGDRPLELVAAVEDRLGAVEEGVRFGEARPAVDAGSGADDGVGDANDGVGDDEDGVGDGNVPGDTGDGTVDPESVFAVVDLPGDLLAEAEGIDPDRAWAAVAGEAVAFETREGASRVGDRAALPAASDSGPDGEGGGEGEGDGDGGDPGGTADPTGGGVAAAYDAVVDGLAEVLREKYGAVRRVEGAVEAEERAFDPELAREAGVPEGPAFGRLAGGEAVTVDGRAVTPEEVHRERTRRFPVPGPDGDDTGGDGPGGDDP